jgi:hypothetical protein
MKRLLVVLSILIILGIACTSFAEEYNVLIGAVRGYNWSSMMANEKAGYVLGLLTGFEVIRINMYVAVTAEAAAKGSSQKRLDKTYEKVDNLTFLGKETVGQMIAMLDIYYAFDETQDVPVIQALSDIYKKNWIMNW